MQVLHYLSSFSLARGGPVRAVLDLADGFSQRGHRVALLTCDRGDAPASWFGQHASLPRVIDLRQDRIGNGPIGFTHRHVLRNEIEACDLLHLHGVWSYSNIQMARLARRCDKPYIVSPRGMLDDWSMEQKWLKKRFFHAIIYRRVLEDAAAIHCTAQAELEQSRKWFPRARGVVIPNLLDLRPFRAPPGPERARAAFPAIRERRPTILFLSRLHYKKGAEILIGAVRILRETGFNCNLMLAGTGERAYVDQLKALVGDLQLDDRVHFLGHVAGDLKISLYQAADIFALPTSQENFGFVFPEALASGTPIITTRGVDIWGELLAGGACSIVDRTPEAFALEIRAIFTDSNRFVQMQAASKPFVFKAYNEVNLLDAFETLYCECMARSI